MSTSEPIACTLAADAMPDRLAAWSSVLTTVTRRTQRADGGLRLELGGEVDVADLGRLVVAEQQCCAFFAFAITVDARGLALEVHAPDDAGDLLTSLFGAPS